MNTLPFNIAVIDDGVNEKLYQTDRLSYNLEIAHDLTVCERVDYDPFLPSHGTTCAAIIKKYSPEAVLSSVKILDSSSRTGMKAQLIRALKWCADKSIRLVNLSLGTIDYRDFKEVKEAVDYAFEKNVIIVAACNNRNIFTCPASFEKVIGVRYDFTGVLKEGEYTFNFDCMDGINISACAKHSLKKNDGTDIATNECNSYAAPMVTAHVYNLLKNNPNMGFDEIIAKLRQGANKNNYTDCIQSFRNPKEPDIPIILVNNNSMNDFEKGLTDKFRSDGFNALGVYEDIKEPDICNGYINIRHFINRQLPSLKKSFYNIYNIFAPDILILSYDNQKSDNILMTGITELDSDIEICVKNTFDVEVKSSYGVRVFNHFDNNQLENLYYYILELFEKEEE
ncbi:S8 family peptidase [Ruminiclostridium papyrosolvens]|uniref:Peptidase S8 n=1 Tax=Ruminiclostridium papyrosolvens C7 TaxID=1330534 RepID=U4R5V7_9FIRM|nr:S8 family serine peptidase [Ruminiclostridium papyrosolvens]EPR13820.1 peptidase S8 [Ruminiclostridium papyrosolvens C7]